ncbi:unnamed protein product [Adineta ricciae]|uniref:Uncharacterized protein n=1 Tax=Adineta ricciae TaxID=249248 RepID=A0A815NR22_ADIRI|nr:unnamed protein product [Adineta ricciae]
MDVQGFLYNGSFNTSFPDHNLILFVDDSTDDLQFILANCFQQTIKYTLFVTTYEATTIGSFAITASGPAMIAFSKTEGPRTELQVTSNYSSSLTSNSESYTRPTTPHGSIFYYQAIEISVSVTGIYLIQSNSHLDTYGYLYDNNFNPTSPNENILLSNDDGGGNQQFLLTIVLQAVHKYILIVTTYGVGVTGTYSIVGLGSNTILFSSANRTVIQSNYSSYLTIYSQSFVRPYALTQSAYYYEAIEIRVSVTGLYGIRCHSLVNTYLSLYNTTFNPAAPYENLVYYDDTSGNSGQSTFTYEFEAMIKYILVVTTYDPGVSGLLSLDGFGDGSINFVPVNMFNDSSKVESMYSSSLTTNSPLFCRQGVCPQSTYFYEAIQLNVSTTGKYMFLSSSLMDTYGYLYDNDFNASFPALHKSAANDDAGTNHQFMLVVVLESMRKYILVVTTYYQNVTGSFSILCLGNDHVNYVNLQQP